MSDVDLIRFAAGSLRGHRLRSWLSLTGVAIGVASVILLTSLGEGARLYVTGEFSSLGTNLIIVIPGKTETLGATPFVSTAPRDLTVADADALQREIPAIRKVAPIALGTGPIEYQGRERESVVVGTTHEMMEVRKFDLGVGRFIPEGVRDAPVCVLGRKLVSELFGHRNPLGEMVRIGGANFRVIGVLAPRGTSLGMDMDQVAEIPVETGLRLFNRSSLFRILAEVRSPMEMEAAKKRVVAVLAERHGEEDVTALTQDAVLATFQKILAVLTLALGGIAAISLTVAGIGIMNVMLVSVSERTREIGLLKAVGVTRGQILGIFLVEAAVLSSGGGLAGLAAGIGAGRLLTHFVPDFPVQPPVWAVVAALTVSIAVGILFGLLPARRAARLDPVAALMRQRA
jgi:putative ABC transport system permease protein